MPVNEERPDWIEIEDIEDEPPRWTWQRIIFVVIILLTLIAFVLYTVAPALFPPAPPPPPRPPLQGA
jgi:hypothetical protein